VLLPVPRFGLLYAWFLLGIFLGSMTN